MALFAICVLIISIASFQFLTWLKISSFADSLDEAGNAKARIGFVVVGRVSMIQLAFGKLTPTSREELKSLFPSDSPVYVNGVSEDFSNVFRPWVLFAPAIVLCQAVAVFLAVRRMISLRKAALTLLIGSALCLVIFNCAVRVNYIADDLFAPRPDNGPNHIEFVRGSAATESTLKYLEEQVKTQISWPFWASCTGEACLFVLSAFFIVAGNSGKGNGLGLTPRTSPPATPKP